METERIQTQLHQSNNQEHYTYTNVPWRLYLRKEVLPSAARTSTQRHVQRLSHACQSLTLPSPYARMWVRGSTSIRLSPLVLRGSTGLEGGLIW